MSTQGGDFPDWFKDRQVQNTELLVDEIATFHTSSPVVFGPFYVAPWNYLQLFVDSDHAAFGGIDIAMDVGFTNIIAEYDFSTTAGRPYTDVLPVAGAFARLRVTYMTGVGTALTSTRLVPTQVDDPYKRGQSQLYVGKLLNQAVGAGATVGVLADIVTSGRAWLSVFTTAAVFQVTVTAVDGTLADVSPVALLIPAASGAQWPIPLTLPPQQIKVSFTNGDAAGRVFSYGLILER